jgi:hypothetical protein
VLTAAASPTVVSDTFPMMDASPACLDIVAGCEELAQFCLAGLLPPSHQNATKEILQKENQFLRNLLKQAKAQIERDHTHKLLMEEENKHL